jgi:integrase
MVGLVGSAKALTARGVQYEKRIGLHADGACTGLCLNVQLSSDGTINRSWIYRYTSKTKLTKSGNPARVEMGLGALDALALDKARVAANHWRGVLNEGQDPVGVRDAQNKKLLQQTLTFKECANKYIQSKRTIWKSEKHAQQWENTLATYAYPTIGHLEPKDIDTSLVVQVLEPIWISKAETASRVRQRIESVMGWANAHKLFTGDNPARLVNHLDKLLTTIPKAKRVNHHPALPYEKLNAFVTALHARPSASALALEFLILTATRTSEVINAKWDEIDFKQKLWVIPAERMKAGKAHTVPLNDRALEILNQQLAVKEGEYVFMVVHRDKVKPLSIGAMLQLMRGMAGNSEYVPHGFRSTFTDWGNEESNHSHEVIEMALAHTIKSTTERAYRRGDLLVKRRNLMSDWQAFIETAPNQTDAGDAHGN